MAEKKLTDEQLLGGQGIALIDLAVSRMGYVWRPTAQHDTGVDGEIEVRDKASGTVTGLLLKVQSKAVSAFQNETAEGFDYWPTARDVQYWLRHNVPVILVVSRPATNEVYWHRVAEPGGRAEAKRFHFVKAHDRLDETACGRLTEIAQAGAPGSWAPALAKKEQLVSNLLPIVKLPPRLYLAETPFRKPAEVNEALKGSHLSLEYVLKNDRLLTVRDLTEAAYQAFCDRGTVEDFAVSEWAESANPDTQRDFVNLLNRCLHQRLRGGVARLRFDRGTMSYYFPSNDRNQPYSYEYKSQKNTTTREVVKRLENKKERHTMGFRHSAVRTQFFRFGKEWYLELTPTYFFTQPDGMTQSRYHEDWLKRIKEFEKNSAVLGQVVMWEHLVLTEDLFAPYPFLAFGPLLSFSSDRGIDDSAWTASEESGSAPTFPDDLFSLL
jgi:hypothetical protein